MLMLTVVNEDGTEMNASMPTKSMENLYIYMYSRKLKVRRQNK